MASVFSRRIGAYVIDFFVVSAFMWFISYIISIILSPYNTYTVYPYLPYVVPIIIMVYFILTEKLAGASIGKSLMYLQVRSKNGAKISWIQAIVRNLTKIYWFPIIFDWAIGKVLRSDRLFNNMTRTVVVDELR